MNTRPAQRALCSALCEKPHLFGHVLRSSGVQPKVMIAIRAWMLCVNGWVRAWMLCVNGWGRSGRYYGAGMDALAIAWGRSGRYGGSGMDALLSA